LKVYTKRVKTGKLLAYDVVILLGDRIAAKAGVTGQELGPLIAKITNGVYERIESMPDEIAIKDGVVWVKKP